MFVQQLQCLYSFHSSDAYLWWSTNCDQLYRTLQHSILDCHDTSGLSRLFHGLCVRLSDSDDQCLDSQRLWNGQILRSNLHGSHRLRRGKILCPATRKQTDSLRVCSLCRRKRHCGGSRISSSWVDPVCLLMFEQQKWNKPIRQIIRRVLFPIHRHWNRSCRATDSICIVDRISAYFSRMRNGQRTDAFCFSIASLFYFHSSTLLWSFSLVFMHLFVLEKNNTTNYVSYSLLDF